VKALLTGGAVALVAGLLMGAVARPDLGGDDRPAGPQILAGWGGGRATGPFDDGAAYAAYKGQVPDYVLGTDWKRSLQMPTPTADAPPPGAMRTAAVDDAPDMPLTRAAYDEPQHAQPAYPSTQGGQSYGADLLAPAHPEDAEPGQG
jgi:hypothetical protein